LAFQQVNLAELNTLLQARFDNPGFWSLGEYRTAFNLALSIFQLGTGRWRNRFIITTIAKRVFYSVPDLAQLQVNGICQVLQPLRIAFNGTPPLGWTSFSDMDALYPGWQVQTTATAGAPSTPQMCGPASVNYFWIWPADAAGGNSLQLDAITNAPQLVNASDFVNLDETEIVKLLDFGQFFLSQKRGGVFFQRTIPLFKGYLEMLADRNSYLMNLSLFRQMTGADFARNFSPRRMSDRTGRKAGIGLR
jgi:hypothetical protein